jgi:hypothetical protein
VPRRRGHLAPAVGLAAGPRGQGGVPR